METLFIDLHVHTIYSQEMNANLSIKETLRYYQNLAYTNGKRVFIRVNDHDNYFGGVRAVEEYLNNKQDYPNIFVIPGIEANVSLNNLIQYKNENIRKDEDYPDSDVQYQSVLKKAHVGAAPVMKDMDSLKKWIDNKDLQVYSKLSKMYLSNSINNGKYMYTEPPIALTDTQKSKYSNIGHQIISSKNTIRKQLGIIIPFSVYENCVKDNLSLNDIVDEFYSASADYLKLHYERYKELPLDEIKNNLKKLCAFLISKDMKNIELKNGIQRINLDEFANIVKNAGGIIDLEHPNSGFEYHKQAYLPNEYLECIDFNLLLSKDSNEIDRNEIKLLMDRINNINTSKEKILASEIFKFDTTGIIKATMLKKALEKFVIFNDEKSIGVEYNKGSINSPFIMERILDCFEKNHIMPNYGLDKHMNYLDKYIFAYKNKLEVLEEEINKLKLVDNNYLLNKFNELKNKGFVKDGTTLDQFMYDRDKKFKNKGIAHEQDVVVQEMYLDYLIGKDVNFQNSSMFTVKKGRELEISNEEVA